MSIYNGKIVWNAERDWQYVEPIFKDVGQIVWFIDYEEEKIRIKSAKLLDYDCDFKGQESVWPPEYWLTYEGKIVHASTFDVFATKEEAIADVVDGAQRTVEYLKNEITQTTKNLNDALSRLPKAESSYNYWKDQLGENTSDNKPLNAFTGTIEDRIKRIETMLEVVFKRETNGCAVFDLYSGLKFWESTKNDN